jgi:hypothetical protein
MINNKISKHCGKWESVALRRVLPMNKRFLLQGGTNLGLQFLISN